MTWDVQPGKTPLDIPSTWAHVQVQRRRGRPDPCWPACL